MSLSTRQEIVIEKYGPASALTLRERTADPVGPDDVAIAVKYSGINFADIQMRLGFYPDASGSGQVRLFESQPSAVFPMMSFGAN